MVLDKAFASAIIKDAGLSEAIKESLSQTLAEGKSLRDWRKGANKIFDKKGLTRLNPWQAETIYRTETTMAFGAGQYAKLQEVKNRFPYWQYVTAGDERVRDSHKALDGKIFKTEDAQYYPPVGFNCRCKARPISKRQAAKRGITGPDTVTPEMRGNLQNAEFIGDKVANFAAWLQKRYDTLPQAHQALIADRVQTILTQSRNTQQNLYADDPDYLLVQRDKESGTATYRHKKADKHDLAANVDAARRLNENGYSVIIREHRYRYKSPNPEFAIIDTKGMRSLSDLKTPDPAAYRSIQNGIKSGFKNAVKQNLDHVVIDIVGNESLEDIAEGLDKAFGLHARIQRTIVLRKGKAVEITREEYRMGKILVDLKRGIK